MVKVILLKGKGRKPRVWYEFEPSPKNAPVQKSGRNMTNCIRIMERRPDVDNAGALCNWLAQERGYGSSGRKKNINKDKGAQLRSLMRL